VEERKVSGNKMVRDTRRLVQDVDLAIENVLGLFVCVLRNVALWAGLNLVEA
jgi:hypothetical protein